MTRFLSAGAVAVALCAALPSNASAAFSIDPYTGGPQTFTRNVVGSSITGTVNDATILGTERETTLTLTAKSIADPGNVLATQLTIAQVAGLLTLSNDTFVSSRAVTLYDGIGSAGLGGVDLAAQGNRFQIDITQIDLTASISIKVRDTANNVGTVTLTGLGVGSAFFNFSAPGYAGVNFTSIDAIEVTYVAPNSTDLAATFFGVSGNPVPEPASLALAATGLVALRGLRRRVAR